MCALTGTSLDSVRDTLYALWLSSVGKYTSSVLNARTNNGCLRAQWDYTAGCAVVRPLLVFPTLFFDEGANDPI